MPQVRVTPYKFFSLWFAWYFGIGIALFLFARACGLASAVAWGQFTALQGPILSVLLFLLFILISWFSLVMTLKSYIILYTMDVPHVMGYYFGYFILLLTLTFIYELVLKISFRVALIDFLHNSINLVIHGFVFYFFLRKYAVHHPSG